METASDKPTFWTTGYLPNGAKVSFTVPIANLSNAYAEALAFTDKLLADGLTLNPKGLEDGEIIEQVGYILRRSKDDGTPVIDLYPINEKTTFRFVMVYLDTPDDVKTFELASGLQLNSIPLYEGDRLERDGKEKSKKYIVKPAAPMSAVIRNNPHYNPDEPDVKKRKPKRLFVRFDAIHDSGASTGGQNGLNANVGASEGNIGSDWDVNTVRDFIASYQGKLDTDQLLIALDVTRFGEWSHGKAAAYAAAEATLKIAKVAF